MKLSLEPSLNRFGALTLSNLGATLVELDFEMTITFVVEKSGTGGVSLKVVTLDANIKKEQTQTVTIHSKTAVFEHVKARLTRCLDQGPDHTYPTCFNQAYKELGLTQSGGIQAR